MSQQAPVVGKSDIMQKVRKVNGLFIARFELSIQKRRLDILYAASQIDRFNPREVSCRQENTMSLGGERFGQRRNPHQMPEPATQLPGKKDRGHLVDSEFLILPYDETASINRGSPQDLREKCAP